MAKKSKAELLDTVNKLEGIDEDTKISMIEDITDTMDSFSETEDWHQKYNELDESWKKKYKDRFFSSVGDEPEKLEPEEPKPLLFSDLFKTE